MTETLKGMGSMPKDAKKAAKPGQAERAAVRELVKAARARGDDLTGPDGLLKSITATVRLTGPEDRARYDELIATVDKHCPVGDSLVAGVPVTVAVDVATA